MRVELIPRETGPRETFRRKAEQTLQDCLDRLQDGGDPNVWGLILRTVGTFWLEGSSDHDVRILA